jgi:hypothetical protein
MYQLCTKLAQQPRQTEIVHDSNIKAKTVTATEQDESLFISISNQTKLAERKVEAGSSFVSGYVKQK